MLVLTDEQLKAIDLAKNWYLNEKTSRPFVILGCAGSGKSTIVKYLIENLGIDAIDNVKYVAYTGRAATVLIQKGNPATTIHKLIYDPVIDPKTKMIIDFKLKEEMSDDISLIIIDEFYMVSQEILDDLLSFNKRVICLGDPNQLPPLGAPNDLFLKPDVILTQPLRQALDSPIIYLAEQARTHKRIKLGDYGEDVKVISKDNLDLQFMMNCNQVIACKNDTVKKINKFFRHKLLGIDKDNWVPQKGEKLICLKNNWKECCEEDDIETNLVNGLICYLTNDLEVFPSTFQARGELLPDFFKNHIFDVPMDMTYFKYGFTSDTELYNKENIMKYNLKEIFIKRELYDQIVNKFTYGYCITCHKSQGSTIENVMFIFEPFKGRSFDIYHQLLYTGITRASKKLVLAI